MLLLGIDLETTGLDTDTCKIIEIGACIYDSERKVPLSMYNSLVSIKEELSSEISALTGITDRDLTKWAITSKDAMASVKALYDRCDYVVAHNGNEFDKKILGKYFSHYGYDFSKPWLDSYVNFEDQYLEKGLKYFNLDFLAAMYGVRTIHSVSHRALTDVLAMLEVISNFDIPRAIAHSKVLRYDISCRVSFDEKDSLKAFGVRRWNPSLKTWGGLVTENQLEEMTKSIKSFELVKKELYA